MSSQPAPASAPSVAPAPVDPLAAPWWAYITPLAVFLAATEIESRILSGAATGRPWLYASLYAAKLLAVGIALFVCRRAWRDLLPLPRPIEALAAIAIGALVILLWVGLDPYYPRLGFLGGERAAFDPTTLGSPWSVAFLAVRFAGLVLVVPIIEELFWCSFAMRWIIDPQFERVPVGKVTPLAAGLTTLGFASYHPEWLPALLTGLLWAGLLAWTRKVSACVLSHAAANLILGLYVLGTHSWRFW